MRTYREQKGLTLQTGWEDRVDFGIDLYQDVPSRSRPIWIPIDSPRTLTPINLNAWEARETKSGVSTDTCRVCHIQHERPVTFHEFIPNESSSASDVENPNDTPGSLVCDEDSDLGSIPELEDEVDLDTLEIPVWLIPNGVTVTFCGGRVMFEREQGPPWQEVLTQMLEEQNQTSGNN